MAESEQSDNANNGLRQQAWYGLAFWMAAGLLLEGLMAFRSPAYLQDPVRRELFRLAHAHGTLLNILLLVAGLYLAKGLIAPPNMALWSLRVGVVAMPLGFLLGGIWHYESDPGIGVFLAPVGGILVILGVVAICLSNYRK